MNKKLLIAVVGAALVASPILAVQADTTVYGHFHESFDHYDNGGTTEKSLLNNNSSRFGIKGFEDLGGGLKAIYQMESGIFNADDGVNGLGAQLRNTFMGFSDSSWGSIKFGRHDTPVKDMSRKIDAFNEEIGDLRNVIGFAAFDNRTNNMIRYDSPSFGGIQFALLHGASEVNSDATTSSGNVTWLQGPFYLGLGYETHKAHNSTAKDVKDMRLVGKFDVSNAFYISALYDMMSDLGSTSANSISGNGIADNDGKAWGLGVGFKMANDLLKLQYMKSDKTDKSVTDNGGKGWVVGVDHNFSKTTKVYFDYAKATNGAATTANISSSYGGHGTTGVPAVAAGKSPKGYSLGMVINF